MKFIQSLMIFVICIVAARRFGAWTMFNAACFSNAADRLTGCGTLDGRRVNDVLSQLWWIKPLKGGSHYRIGW